MTGRTGLSDDVFFIGGCEISAVIPGLAGIAFLGAGMALINMERHIAHALLGLGITIMSLGIYLYFHSRDYRIRIDGEKKLITIVEKGFRKSNNIEISCNKFFGILVQPRLGDGRKSGRASRYEVLLIGSKGSTLLFAEYKREEDALAFAKDLQLKYGFVLYNDDEISRLLKAKRRSLKTKPAVVEPKKSSGISVLRQGEKVSLKWKTVRDPATMCAVVLGMYGVMHLIVFTAVPLAKDNSLIYLIYSGTILAGLIAIIIIGVTILGTFTLNLENNRINYHVKIFGAKLGERSMDVGSIILVKNSIGRRNATIQVVSERGLIAIMRMIELVKKEGIQITDLSILGEVGIFNNENINIPVGSLTLSDRFFIEDMILSRMSELK